jgi:hypothetical protein
MVTKAELHAIVDQLPDDLTEEAARRLDELSDPVLHALLIAPDDDEPETAEERAAVDGAQQALRGGRVVDNATLARRLGL